MDAPNIIGLLPIEMIEKVFSYLSDRSIVTVSKVCRLWFEIAERIAMSRCDHNLLHEAKAQCRIQESPWMKLLNWKSLSDMLLSGSTTHQSRIFSFAEPSYIEDEKHYVLYGSYLIVSVKATSKIHIFDFENYDPATNSFPTKSEYDCGEGHIQQLHAVPRLHILLVLSDTFSVYTLPDFAKNIYEMKKIDHVIENYESEKPKMAFTDVSIDGLMMAARTDNVIFIFQMEYQNNHVLRLKFAGQYQAPTAIYRFSLWKNFLTVLLETGFIIRWSPTEELTVGPYQEIRYRNPVWICGDKIFCSTLRSRELLAMWHLEYGTSYWLAGNPFVGGLQRYGSGIIFMDDGRPVTDEMLCVCSKHSLLFTGMAMGNVAIYKNSDSFTNDNPRLTKTVSHSGIDGINVDYTENSIYVVVRTANTLSGWIIKFPEP
ncbi:UNVERIFIED_CONTAM: hypothetical protein PYX00_004908 [Menopon gallinae]|uniref:F-box domain-containing protein n=1 Tax=Menopon gallinae TaxID=328185 RepID=A0AAW2I755_9NEOP